MSTKCIGKKKNGNPCTARTNNANGYCLVHQGQVPVAPVVAPAVSPVVPVIAPAVSPVVPVVAPAVSPVVAAPATTPPQTTNTVVHSNNPLPWIVGMIALVFLCLLLTLGVFLWKDKIFAFISQVPSVVVATPIPALPTPQTATYPLAGQRYESPQGDSYSAVWTNDGRLWQPNLPTGADRIAHTVGITIEEGSYAFDGVECSLHLDPTRNGKGSQNPITVSYGNDLRFSVDTADNGQAWALVECRGNFSSGFQIRSLGSLLP